MISSILNRKSFIDVCNGTYGRKIIYSSANEITRENVVIELGKALSKHWQNRTEIEYLDNYYRGVHPILFREKKVRPEINNKISENHAYEIVEFKTAQNFGEPVQYVRRGTDENKSEEIKNLNDYMYSESKGACDIELGRWRSICGTGYRFVYMDKEMDEYDETPFGIECLDPKDNFVVYSTRNGRKPLFSVSQLKDEDNANYYVIYTNKYRFEIQNGKIKDISDNGIDYIPVIEYPNNERRLSDIEIVITMLDALDKMQSDRINGIEQFVQAIFKFINCEISGEQFDEMRQKGMLIIKTTANGLKADADLMTAELNQEQSQVAKDDIYKNIIQIIGMPSREQNTGGDTGQAVYLRNGWDFAEQRAELQEPIFKKSEREFLKIVFHILKTKQLLHLKLSDVEIKVTRSKTDNMSVKANVLTQLLNAGIDYQTAIKTCDLWSDPEETYIKSKKRMKSKYEGLNEPQKTIIDKKVEGE